MSYAAWLAVKLSLSIQSLLWLLNLKSGFRPDLFLPVEVFLSKEGLFA
jgi:hypothetical protein